MTRVTLAVCAVVIAVGTGRAADPKPVWEIDTARPKMKAMEVSWVRFSSDGKSLVAGVRYVDGDKRVPFDPRLIRHDRVIVWDVETRKERLCLEEVFGVPDTFGVDSVAVMTGGTLVIDGSNEVRLSDGKSRSVSPNASDVRAHFGSMLGAWVDPKARVAARFRGDEVNGYRLQVGKLSSFVADPKKGDAGRWLTAELRQLRGDDAVRTAVADPGLTRFAVATEQSEATFPRPQTLRLFAITTGDKLEVAEVAAVKTPHRSGIVSSRFSPDGKTLALGSMDCSVSLWDVAGAGKEWKPWETIPAGRFTVSCLAFSPDGRTLAAGTFDSGAANLFMIDVRGGKPVSSRTLGGSVTALAYSPDGNLLATGDVDAKTEVCRVRVWDAAAVRGN